ncbi:hypothetical protein MTR67_011464 [Solanum verrucosum]|uniref:Uncharacterized protein n=1 Tax=Solanum verrucosum TaxID=315347 RepID=A0AAF0QDT1_SOLVR|nr:hypothetical protein MTR67_011464 [Solanum verrucosum]
MIWFIHYFNLDVLGLLGKKFPFTLTGQVKNYLARYKLNRLAAKTTQLESEKMQKEVQVQKLMEENVKLTTLLDKKEAQLLAMNEQCKVMALSASNI